MKTFILQQVKCCHLSPSLLKLIACSSISTLYPFHPFILFDFLCFSSCFLTSITCFSFFGDHLPPTTTSTPQDSIISHVVYHYLIVCLCISATEIFGGTVVFGGGRVLWAEGFNISQPLSSRPDLSPPISAMGSQLLMKSQSVLWTVTRSWVEGFSASRSCFSVMSFNFQFSGVEEGLGGEFAPPPSFFFLCLLFFIFETLRPLQSLVIWHLCFYLSISWAMNVSPTVQV